jgi:hypothetical protein
MKKNNSLNEIDRGAMKGKKTTLGVVSLIVGLLIVGLVYFVMRRTVSKNEGFAGPCYTTAASVLWPDPAQITHVGGLGYTSGIDMTAPNMLSVQQDCDECSTANATYAYIKMCSDKAGSNLLMDLKFENGPQIVRFKLLSFTPTYRPDGNMNYTNIPIGVNGNDVVMGSIPAVNSFSGKGRIKINFLDSSKCPQDCIPGPWTDTSTCPSCGPSTTTKSQTRIVTPAIYDGNCSTTDSLTTQNVPCAISTCESQCVGNNDWVNTGSCVAPSPGACGPGAGKQTQTQTLKSVVTNACQLADQTYVSSLKTRTVACDLPVCPVDCIGSFIDSTSCPSPCGPVGSTKNQIYKITTPQQGTGKACPVPEGYQISVSCPVCPVDCVGGWVDYTKCPTCGPANTTKLQQYVVTTPQQGTGAYCPVVNGMLQSVSCGTLPPCEDPPPVPSTPVSPYPFTCTDTYTIKIVYSPPDANKNVTLYAMLLLKTGATDVATKSSTWTVTSAPNFAVKTGAPVIQHWTDKVTWQFPLAQTYTVQYSLTYGGKTCTFSFPIIITGQTCTDPCTNYNTATNSCQAITLPPAPPRTKNGPRCQDVKCGPNQFKDCPVVYQPGNTTTNPCGPGNVYDFVTGTCSPSGEYCCNYSLTTGGLDQTKFAGARNDTKCVDNLTQQYTLKATSPTKCSAKYTPGIDNPCCDPRAATLAKCAPYWQAVPGWKKNPMNCQVAPPYQGFKDYDGYETQEIAPVEQESVLFTKGALQIMRQKMINIKSLFI